MTDRAIRVHQLEFSQRSLGTVLGSLIAVVVVMGLAAPRTFAFTLPLLALAFLLAVRSSAGAGDATAAAAGTRERTMLIGTAAAFFAWAAVSGVWSVAPLLSVTKGVVAGLIFAAVVVVAGRSYALSDGDASRLGEGVWLGVLIGSLFVLVEALTDRVLMRAFVNLFHISPEALKPQMFFIWQAGRLVSVVVDELNRQMVSLVLFAGAGLLAARATLRRPWAAWTAVAIAAVVAGAVAASGSETAKLALVVATVTFVLALLSRRAAFTLLVMGWLSASLLIVPALRLAHTSGLDTAPALAKALERGSGRARFEILNAFVARIGEAPIVGHGANAAYVLGPKEIDDTAQQPAPAGPAKAPAKAPLAQHPHNAYLQIWYDLGLVGALLFSAFGLAILACLRRLEPDEQPPAFATFAAAAAILAPSYGLWQFWYMAMFGVGAMALTVAIRARRAMPASTA